MSFLILLIVLSHLTSPITAIGAGLPAIQNEQKQSSDESQKDGEVVLNVQHKKEEKKVENEIHPAPIKPPLPSKNETTNSTQTSNATVSEHKKFKPSEVMESGALVRGVLVVVALSVLVIIYMAVKTYYGKRNKPAMVRKYGVRTRRSDIEMTPLPLEEDEDDETLFEVGNTNR